MKTYHQSGYQKLFYLCKVSKTYSDINPWMWKWLVRMQKYLINLL